MRFLERAEPVETVTGVFHGSSRRTSESGIFVTAELSVPVSMKSALGQNARPESGSGLILNDFFD